MLTFYYTLDFEPSSSHHANPKFIFDTFNLLRNFVTLPSSRLGPETFGVAAGICFSAMSLMLASLRPSRILVSILCMAWPAFLYCPASFTNTWSLCPLNPLNGSDGCLPSLFSTPSLLWSILMPLATSPGGSFRAKSLIPSGWSFINSGSSLPALSSSLPSLIASPCLSIPFSKVA